MKVIQRNSRSNGAIERGLVVPTGDETPVTIYMENSGQVAVATVQTPGGMVAYDGAARIDGVPGTHAPVPLEFRDTAGSSCGALLPTGNAADMVEGVVVTLIDNGMPCVVMKAADVGITGYEDRDRLDADPAVVDLQRLAGLVPVQVEQRKVPPLVGRAGGSVVPVSGALGHPVHALAGTAQHLEHMGHGMVRADVVRLQLERAPRSVLGAMVVAGLLEREGVHRRRQVRQ